MKKTWMSLLSFVLAAAILGGGYALIALSDRVFGAHEEVTQLPKDSELNAVRRFDGGADIRLYPFDEKRDEECIPLTESVLYEKMFALWRESYVPEDESQDESLVALRRSQYREELNYRLYDMLDRLSGRLCGIWLGEHWTELMRNEDDIPDQITSRWMWDRMPDLLAATQYQESNDICYVEDLPLWVSVDGVRYRQTCTAAFRMADQIEDIALYYFALSPADTSADESADAAEGGPFQSVGKDDTASLETAASTLVEQFDAFQKGLPYPPREIVISYKTGERDEWAEQGVRYHAEDGDNPFLVLCNFFRDDQLETITSRESVLCGDELWFVIQSAEMRLVLPYSPENGQFYGMSWCPLG